jgi:hypothetical protein
MFLEGHEVRKSGQAEIEYLRPVGHFEQIGIDRAELLAVLTLPGDPPF